MRNDQPTLATQLFAAAMRDPAQRAALERDFADFTRNDLLGPTQIGTVMRSEDIARSIASATEHLRTHNVPRADGSYYDSPQPRGITFRNTTTGETITVADTDAARALTEQQRLPRTQRRAKEKAARRLLKKTRKALGRPA